MFQSAMSFVRRSALDGGICLCLLLRCDEKERERNIKRNLSESFGFHFGILQKLPRTPVVDKIRSNANHNLGTQFPLHKTASFSFPIPGFESHRERQGTVSIHLHRQDTLPQLGVFAFAEPSILLTSTSFELDACLQTRVEATIVEPFAIDDA
jgi:hypothetical protein